MSEHALRLQTPAEPGAFPNGFDDSRICYWRDGGRWYLYLPRGGCGDLSNHTVDEHENGTVTVSPSILMTSTRRVDGVELRRRHGFLRRGVWEPCGDDR